MFIVRIVRISNNKNRRKMSNIFAQVLNPITGKNEWEIRDSNYDYHQEIARAAFGDMLHDKERNQKYFVALQNTIKKLHNDGKKAHVLDIGTGTGILSMMAVAAGADTVTACEAFIPMANCAERVIKANGMVDKIRLIKKRSTDIVIGDEDMPLRANVLVAELLDTELIGEGAISIYNHAHKNLLTDDAICIPASATCYAQVVESPLAMQWNRIKLIANLDGDVLLKAPPATTECKGDACLHDIQANQLPQNQIVIITKPYAIFDFNFSSKTPMKTHRTVNLSAECEREGRIDMIIFWWEIRMDEEKKLTISCAPYWAHPDFDRLAANRPAHIPVQNTTPWRDHWMQAIYYIPKPLLVTASKTKFILSANHDEYSFWFDAWSLEDHKENRRVSRHSCSCALHQTYSRNRIGQINQSKRSKIYLGHLEETINDKSHVLLLGDGCFLGLTASKLNAASVTSVEQNRFSRQLIESFVEYNELKNVTIVSKLSELSSERLRRVTHIFAEPYFLTSILPWDNLYFGTLLQQLYDSSLPENIQIVPYSCKIYAVPVEFLDLQKIRTPLNTCEGFDLKYFDEMIDASSALADSNIEAQPLWEYPCRALSNSHEILCVKFDNFIQDQSTAGVIQIEKSGSCNGLALWIDWNIDSKLSPKSIITTGPTKNIIPGELIEWDMFVRQGVHIIAKQKQLESIKWKVDFKAAKGNIKFYFDV